MIDRAYTMDLPDQTLRLSREERDHIATHALDELVQLGLDLHHGARNGLGCSDVARKIAALSNLLGDIGWEREAGPVGSRESKDQSQAIEGNFILGELFPVAQLRPWLEEWQRQDNEALKRAEGVVETESGHWEGITEHEGRKDLADAQTKLGAGAILLARIEKWMACKEN